MRIQEEMTRNLSGVGLVVHSKDGFSSIMGMDYPKMTKELIMPKDELSNLIRPQFWLNVPNQV